MPRGKRKSHATRSFGRTRGNFDVHRQVQYTSKSRGPAFLESAEASLQSKLGNWQLMDSANMSNVDGLTLAQEARYTARYGQASECQNSRLRNKPINFACAGSSDQPEDAARTEPQNLDMKATCSDSPQANNASATRSRHRQTAAQRTMCDWQRHSANKSTPAPFETTGHESNDISSTVPLDTPLRSSSSASNSSDEVILFRGRKGIRPTNLSSVAIESQSHTQCHSTHQKTEDQIRTKPVKDWFQRASGLEGQDSLRYGVKHSRQSQRWNRITNRTEDLILDDYIANMRENGELCEDMRQSVPPECTQNNTVASSETQANAPDEDDTVSGELITTIHDSIKLRQPAPAHAIDDVDKAECQGQDRCDADALVEMLADQRLETKNHVDRTATQPSNDLNSTTDSDLDETHSPDQFDLMDWHRPSLQRSKNKWAHAQFESSQHLHAVWENDRLKKKQRKKQREELRALGLLGQKTRQDDLKVKYPTGISLAEVVEEFRTFLKSMDEVLSFPPLDVHARKLIHELASRLNIKSKSTGKSEQRRPILHRTKQTLPNAESILDQMAARIQRRYLPRLDVKDKRGHIKMAATSGSSAATSYRDGDIVGAMAPELGNENRGRTMLEKMGWSNGTALGATHKGILQPVTHAVRRSKAGLG